MRKVKPSGRKRDKLKFMSQREMAQIKYEEAVTNNIIHRLGLNATVHLMRVDDGVACFPVTPEQQASRRAFQTAYGMDSL